MSSAENRSCRFSANTNKVEECNVKNRASAGAIFLRIKTKFKQEGDVYLFNEYYSTQTNGIKAL
jgi:hypothetical protein